MTLIKSLDLKRLHQEEDFGFHQLMIIETSKCTDPKVVPVHKMYTDLFATFDEALKPGGKDPMTAELTSLDSQRDQAYAGMSSQARNMLRHFDPDKAAIARVVWEVIEKYGNPCSQPYIKENGIIENLIQELRVYDNPADGRPEIESTAITHDRLAAIGLKEWVDHLERLNKQFIQLFSDRNAAQSAIITGASKATREATDKAYRDLARRINALAEVNGEADYLELINKMNKLIDYQLSVLAARNTKKANKDKEDDRPVTE